MSRIGTYIDNAVIVPSYTFVYNSLCATGIKEVN